MDLLKAISIISRFTNTAIISPNQTFFSDNSLAFFGSIKTNTPAEVGFYDELANFQRMLSIFEDPTITVEGDKGAKIKIESDEATAYFLTSDTSLIRRTDFDLEAQLSRTLEAPKLVEINFSEDLVDRIKQATNTIDNSKVILISTEGSIKVQVKDVDMLASDSNSIVINVPQSAHTNPDKEFQIVVEPTIFGKMPKGGFKAGVAYSSRMNTYRVVCVSSVETEEDLVVIVPTDVYNS